ncbi:unnamed protein product, partial [Linum tenue]
MLSPNNTIDSSCPAAGNGEATKVCRRSSDSPARLRRKQSLIEDIVRLDPNTTKFLDCEIVCAFHNSVELGRSPP